MIPFEVIALSPYAREMLAEIAGRRAMKRFHDGAARLIEIRAWEPGDWSALTALYDAFLAAGDRTRGLPPLNAPQRASWLEELVTRGPNLTAWAGQRIVGHAALVAHDGGASHELVLFVHPDYREAGIGAALRDALRRVAPREGHGGRWQRLHRLVASATGAVGVRLLALIQAVRLAMIPLVCAVVIALVSADPRGRVLALIVAVASVVFGVGLQMRAIVFGPPHRANRRPR